MYSVEGVLQATALLLFALIVFVRILARKLTHKQGEMLYYPEMPPNARTVVPSPEEFGLTSERLVVEAPDGVRLRGYFIQGSHLSNITIVHFHGNAGNVGHRIPLAALFIEQLDVNVVLAEYRGYGLSDTPAHVTEDGIMQDAEAWLEHTALLPYVNPEGIVVHGSSLGGAVGVALASAHANKMAALMVENTFTSISAMTDTLFAQIVSHQPISLQRKAALTTLFLYLLKPLVLMLDWRSIDKMPSLTCPVLFISGQEDELVPKEHMSTLYKQCASSSKKLAQIPGGKHNETYLRPQTMEEMREFLTEYVRPLVGSERPSLSSIEGASAAMAAAGGDHPSNTHPHGMV